jgi:asparagine N-glycosylation enzyme membrane subunit Stt3
VDTREKLIKGRLGLLALAGPTLGLYLLASGNSAIGSNVLIASVGVILYVLKGNADAFKN